MMQSVKLLASELSWCARCAFRFSKLSFKHTLPLTERHVALLNYAPHLRYSTDVIPPASFEGETKQYAPKIQRLVDEISQLTLLEVADLNELLKKTLKITGVPSMAYAAPASAAPAAAVQQEEEPEPVKQQKSSFTVKLVKIDEAKKVAIIKEIKNIVAGMNLVQAKKFVESLPQTLKTDISKEESDKLKTTLEAIGAIVEVD